MLHVIKFSALKQNNQFYNEYKDAEVYCSL